MDSNVGILDKNATGVIFMLLPHCSQITYIRIEDLSLLGSMCVMWRNKKTVSELANDENIPEHEKGEKIRKINFFKNVVLKNMLTDTTIFGMRKDHTSPIVIVDGIHRSIGIEKAIRHNVDIKEQITLRILLFEGESISDLDDYRLSIY